VWFVFTVMTLEVESFCFPSPIVTAPFYISFCVYHYINDTWWVFIFEFHLIVGAWRFSPWLSHFFILCNKTTWEGSRLNTHDTPLASRSHSHPSHSQTSLLLVSSLSLGVPVPHTTQCNTLYPSRADPSVLAFSLSLHRHPYICILFSSRFIYSSLKKKSRDVSWNLWWILFRKDCKTKKWHHIMYRLVRVRRE
jgi:hypothetical protein